MAKIALGNQNEVSKPDFIRSVLTEFVVTFLFVFAGVASVITAGRMVGGKDSIMGLTAGALAQAMLVAVMTAIGVDVSAAHMNPAVTISFVTTGFVTVVRCAFYIVAQLLASATACLLLQYVTGGPNMPVHALAAGMDPLQGVIMEAIFTYMMVFAVYALILDPKKGAMTDIAPLVIGLVVAANSLAGGAFSGASMNPARSFGPALASGEWANHWVYWVGPIAGSVLAGLSYYVIYLGKRTHEPLTGGDDGMGF